MLSKEEVRHHTLLEMRRRDYTLCFNKCNGHVGSSYRVDEIMFP